MRTYKFHTAGSLGMAFCLVLSACGGGSSTPAEPPKPVGKLDITANATALNAAFDEAPQQLQLTVKNTGAVAVTNLTPKASSALMVDAANTCAGMTLAVNASCTLSYLIKPTAPAQGSVGLELQFSDDGVVRQAAWSIPYNFGPSQWETAPVWANQQGNAAHSGYVPVSLQAANFKFDWELGPPSTDAIVIGLTSDKDKVYASIQQDHSVCCGLHVIYALSASDGSLVWQKQLPCACYQLNEPVFADGDLFFTSWEPLERSKWRLDASTGEIRARESSSSRSIPDVAPVSWDHELYYSLDDSFSAYAHDSAAQTWAGVWTLSSLGTSAKEPAVDGKYVYRYATLGFDSTATPLNGADLVAFDRLSGGKAFEIKDQTVAPVYNAGWLVLDEGSAQAFVVGQGKALAFDLAGRKVAWEVSGDFAWQASYGDQTLFVKSQNKRLLSALDAKTGAVLWTWASPDELISDIIVTKTHLFVASANQTNAISRSSHAMEWATADGGRLMLTNTGKLIIARTDGALIAISLR